MNEPAIVLRDVSCFANGTRLVEHLTVDIPRGETFVLLGQSGSGKTSTLKLVNRLLEPTSGAVTVEGKSAAEWDPITLRRRMGYVIQEAGLLPHFTVRQNAGLVPRLEGWDSARTAARVDEVLRLVGLDPSVYGERRPRELSGGQRQRVGVARALAADPPILLMDEPFGALDPLTRAALQREFRELLARLQKTVLFVTHDVIEALLLGSRIALMEDGRIVASGAPAEFVRLEHPSVKEFLKPARDMLSSIAFV